MEGGTEAASGIRGVSTFETGREGGLEGCSVPSPVDDNVGNSGGKPWSRRDLRGG